MAARVKLRPLMRSASQGSQERACHGLTPVVGFDPNVFTFYLQTPQLNKEKKR